MVAAAESIEGGAGSEMALQSPFPHLSLLLGVADKSRGTNVVPRSKGWDSRQKGLGSNPTSETHWEKKSRLAHSAFLLVT